MSLRLGRAVVGLAAALAALAALPASALAAGETLSVSSANTQAGGSTSLSVAMSFDNRDIPLTLITLLPPGMLGDFTAGQACLQNLQETSPCRIGSVTFHTDNGDIGGSMYVVPAQGNDAAGILLIPDRQPLNNQYVGVSLNSTEPGGLVLTAHFPKAPPGAEVLGLTLNFADLNSQPFIRLPSSCATAASTMSVTYWSGTPTGTAQDAFTPTGCNSLTYAPTLDAAITEDSTDSGAKLLTVIHQGATESAGKSIVLQLPKGLSPNLSAVASCLKATRCTIGVAAADSPLVPNLPPVDSAVTLSGSASEPTVSFMLPPPFAFTINGTYNLASNSITFAAVPDLPLTTLSLYITGPSGGEMVFQTDCAPANVGATFTPQSGTGAVSVTAPIKFIDCAQNPTASGSAGGLASRHPKLKFRITHGKGAGNVAAVAIGLPGGLRFSRSAIVSHRTCKKATCSTTTTISGLGVSGARAKSVTIRGGRLLITLQKAVGELTLTVSGPLVTEGKALQSKVKKHKTTSLAFTVKVTDAKDTATTLPLKLRAH